MKKLIETMAAFLVAFVLVSTMVGCGQATVDQGEVNTTPDEKDPTLPGAGGGEGGDVLENKGKGGDDKGKAAPTDKDKSAKPSDEKGKSASKETKKK